MERKRPPGLYRRGKVWWVKYYVNGRAVRESTGTEKEQEAGRYLDTRKGAVAQGAPLPPRLDRITYDEVAADLREHYRTTGARSVREAEFRLAHLDTFFRGCRSRVLTLVDGSSLKS